jgi:hypothetical protein
MKWVVYNIQGVNVFIKNTNVEYPQYIQLGNSMVSQSQWPLGLRHELSSPAQTLEPWVRIPLKAWMSVCVYSVCAVLYTGSGLTTG